MFCGDARAVARGSVALAMALGLAGGACSIRLDDVSTPSGASQGRDPPQQKEDVPLAVGCALLSESGSSIDGVYGRARRVVLPGQSEAAWLVDRAMQGENATERALLRGAVASDACAIDGATLTTALDVGYQARDVVVAGGAAWLYVTKDFDGHGVAPWDAAQGRFVAPTALLWTDDRPPFGDAAVIDGSSAFVMGCLGARFLDADCWLARAPLSQLDDAASYDYVRGGGHFTPQLDDAFPVFSGGSVTSLTWNAAHTRVLAAYVPPLGDTIVLRAGLSPAGPWSGPHVAARCAVPKGAFCHGVTLYPELPAPPEHVVLSYAIGTFEPGAVDADPLSHRTRVARVRVPAGLP